MLIGEYFYSSCNLTHKKNRKIEFIRPSDDSTEIYANVSALKEENKWILLSTIKTDKLRVSLDTISKKIDQIGHRNITKFSEDEALNTQSLKKQDDIIKSLATLGERKIEIITTFNYQSPYEIPVELKILPENYLS